MERDESSGGDAYVEARIPGALYERVEALFREYRGYEPSSVQECLSVVCDLAEQRTPETGPTGRAPDSEHAANQAAQTGTEAPQTAGTGASVGDETPTGTGTPAGTGTPTGTETAEGAGAATGGGATGDPEPELRGAIDDVFPTDWDSTAETERLLPLVVSRYVAGTDADTRAERESAALSAVAARDGTTAEDLRRTLVEDVYGGSALPGDLATEFLSEALEKVERRIDDAKRETLSPSDLVGTDVETGGDRNGATSSGPEVDVEYGEATPTDADVTPTDAEVDVEYDGATADEDGPDVGLDLGPGSADLPPELADEMASDGGAVQSVDDRVDNLFTGPNGLTEIGLDSMIAGARADCEICGASRSIESLETTTEASDDRRVDLVCPDCK